MGEDGAAVLDTLLKSKPTDDLLQEDKWESMLQVIAEGHHKSLIEQIRKLWQHLRRGQTKEPPVTAAMPASLPATTPESDITSSGTKSKTFLAQALERARQRVQVGSASTLEQDEPHVA